LRVFRTNVAPQADQNIRLGDAMFPTGSRTVMQNLIERLAIARSSLRSISSGWIEGSIEELSGLTVQIGGLNACVSIGDRVALLARSGQCVPAEIIGLSSSGAKAMAFGSLEGLSLGSRVRVAGCAAAGVIDRSASLAVDACWLGRVVDPLGTALDGGETLTRGKLRPVHAAPIAATLRARLGPRLATGVRAIDCFVSCREGQRLGLFAGSGVGKSTLLAMLARHTKCDVFVIALVGERGREVREFIEDDLGAEGLARAVVVVATSDTPPLMRREAAYAAMTIAEHFRDAGCSVMLLMDSVTRFCLALREIALSMGEPPATRGYPPSVFAELPRLLERAGPGYAARPGQAKAGQITGLFSVLVEGDDHNEPIADAVRGILDGHVVLDRGIAELGRYPAVNILRSLSRAVPGCNSLAENRLINRARGVLAMHEKMADLVRLGAYRPGTDATVDEALQLAPRIEDLLKQTRDNINLADDSFRLLARAMNDELFEATCG
jgi:flagellum-specific ATP synthase